jgi:4-hydroxybenzoate polyprenyltransferase
MGEVGDRAVTAQLPGVQAPARSDGAFSGKWRVWLRLGRVSNLPTVWTNTLAGVILARPHVDPVAGVILAAAFSSFYVGGMFLNDAFDRTIDAVERPERPIPRGLVSVQDVFVAGFFMLGLGTALVGATAFAFGEGGYARAVVASLALSVAIVVYNAWHKGNPFSTVLMGACRVLVYLTAALAVTGRLDPPVVGASALLLAYVMGLTYVAKQENLAQFRNMWPLVPLVVPFAVTAPALRHNYVAAVLWVAFFAWVAFTISRLLIKGRGVIPLVVVRLISAISLLDALVVAFRGSNVAALWLATGFAATLLLQRFVKGT